MGIFNPQTGHTHRLQIDFLLLESIRCLFPPLYAVKTCKQSELSNLAFSLSGARV